ncbi:MAG: hypothetical protein LLF75_01275 [Eubacteriales bacterium]|nr:hypothetical protein [Eubacteriales bacterium]
MVCVSASQTMENGVGSGVDSGVGSGVGADVWTGVGGSCDNAGAGSVSGKTIHRAQAQNKAANTGKTASVKTRFHFLILVILA